MAEPASFEELQDAVAAEGHDPLTITPRRLLEDTEMDITPMIDCTFLLLIFFLLTFKADEGATLALPPAKYGIPVSAKNAVVITVDKGEPELPAKVYKGNTSEAASLLDSSDLKAMEDEIAAYVEKEVAGGTRKQYLLIKAAESVKHRDVARVARAASRVADIEQLHVAVLEAQ